MRTPHSELEPELLISLAEAARRLGGVTIRHLRALSTRGELRLVNLGRRVMVPVSEIQRIASGGAR